MIWLIVGFILVLVLFIDDEQRFILSTYADRTGIPLKILALILLFAILLSPAGSALFFSTTLGKRP